MSALPFAAVLWDMDGVLVDTNDLHYHSWRDLCRPYGVELEETLFKTTFGMRNDLAVQHYLGKDLATPEFTRQISARKEAHFRELAKGGLQPLPGVRTWLAYVYSLGLPQAVASSAPRDNITVVMDALNIAPYFAATLSGEEVQHGKPSPDVFLAAARRLKVEPTRCLVIEDAVVGVQAAKSAGMRCLAVSTTRPAEELRQADWVVPHLGTLTPAEFFAPFV